MTNGVMKKYCVCIIRAPSLDIAGEHGKHHAMCAHKTQAVSDWLNPHSFGTMSAFGFVGWPDRGLYVIEFTN